MCESWILSENEPIKAGRGASSGFGVARFAFKELELNRVEIVIATENKTSIRVAEKIGALREGILRKRIVVSDTVYDAFMFSLLTDDLSGKPKKTSNT